MSWGITLGEGLVGAEAWPCVQLAVPCWRQALLTHPHSLCWGPALPDPPGQQAQACLTQLWLLLHIMQQHKHAVVPNYLTFELQQILEAVFDLHVHLSLASP